MYRNGIIKTKSKEKQMNELLKEFINCPNGVVIKTMQDRTVYISKNAIQSIELDTENNCIVVHLNAIYYSVKSVMNTF
jgi:hypothetical protein